MEAGSGRRTPAVLSGVLHALVAVLAAVACWRYAPHVGHVGGVHSDGAMPQLIANHQGTTPFDLFSWGQDRFGAWPFLIARGIRAVTGIGWTPEGLYWLMMAGTASAV